MDHVDGFPDGLIEVQRAGESPRIVVSHDEVDHLIIGTHTDLLHQGYKKVITVLGSLFYWPGMDKRIQQVCGACDTCVKTTTRRHHMKSVFNSRSVPSTLTPSRI